MINKVTGITATTIVIAALVLIGVTFNRDEVTLRDQHRPSSHREAKKEKQPRDLPTQRELLVNASSPAQIKQLFDQLGDSSNSLWIRGGHDILGKAVHSWFANDPTLALLMIGELPNDGTRSAAVMIARPYFAQMPEEFLEMIQEKLDPVNVEQLSFFIYEDLGKLKPNIGISLLNNLGQGKRKTNAVNAFFQGYATENADESISRVAGLEYAEDQNTAWNAIIKRVSAKGEESLSYVEDTRIPSSFRKQLAEEALAQIASSQGGEGVLQAFNEYPDLREFGGKAVSRIGNRDWVSFVESLDQHVAEGLVNLDRDMDSIVNGLAYKDPDRAIAFVAGINGNQEAAARALAERFAKYERRNDSISLIGQLPKGIVRDAALRPLIEILQKNGEESEVQKFKALLSASTSQ